MSEIERALRQLAGRFRMCREPLDGPSRAFEGTAVFAMCVDPSGSINATLKKTDLPREAARCLLDELDRVPFSQDVSDASFVIFSIDLGDSYYCPVPSGQI